MCETQERKDLDLTRKVTVKNMTNLDTYVILMERPGSIKVPRKGTALFTIGELMQQYYASVITFVGPGRDGSHADLYIMDKDVRVECGFETDDGKRVQEVNDEKVITDLFNIEKIDVFYDSLKRKIITLGEKQTLRSIISSGKVDSHEKIQIAQKYLANEEIEFPKNKGGRPRKNA